MSVRTLCTEITERTYPIAVACLPGGFVLRSQDEVLGRMLVINGLGSRKVKEYGKRPIVVLENTWMETERFNEIYQFVRPHDDIFWIVQRR